MTDKEKRVVRRITDNPELVAIDKVNRILAALPGGVVAQQQVLMFVAQRVQNELVKAEQERWNQQTQQTQQAQQSKAEHYAETVDGHGVSSGPMGHRNFGQLKSN